MGSLDFGGSGMPAGALREDQQTYNDKGPDHRRRQRPAESEPSMARGLIEKVSDSGSQGSRQNEGRPKKRHAETPLQK